MQNSLTPSLFTLEFSNFPKNCDKKNVIYDLWEFFEKVLYIIN